MVALANKNCSFSQIRTQVNRPRSTIQEFLNRFQEGGSKENLPIPGRPTEPSSVIWNEMAPEVSEDCKAGRDKEVASTEESPCEA